MILLFSYSVQRDCHGALGPHFHSWDFSYSAKLALGLHSAVTDRTFWHYPCRQLPYLRIFVHFKTQDYITKWLYASQNLGVTICSTRPCTWMDIVRIDALVSHQERRSFFACYFSTSLSYGFFCGCHRLKQSNKLKGCRANCLVSIELHIQRAYWSVILWR